MRKINESVSDIFVKKIGEISVDLLKRSDIERYWVRAGGSKVRISYAVTLVLAHGFIRIARDIYAREGCNEDDVYWNIISFLIQIHTPSGALIGGEKSLEILMKNFSIPDVLILYTRTTNMRIRFLSGREVHFRTLVSGEKSGRKNMFPFLVKYAQVEKFVSDVAILCPEIALLDALSLRRHDEGVSDALIIKFLRTRSSSLSESILRDAVKLRYIRSVNRLRSLAYQNGMESLYSLALDIIRKEGGGCFVKI